MQLTKSIIYTKVHYKGTKYMYLKILDDLLPLLFTKLIDNGYKFEPITKLEWEHSVRSGRTEVILNINEVDKLVYKTILTIHPEI